MTASSLTLVAAPHPDPRLVSRANGTADRSGHPKGSAAWLHAYRAAYGALARDASAYLDQVDARIEALLAGERT